MKTIIKKILVILAIFMAIFTIYKIANTYALFETKMSGMIKPTIGRWNITVNGTDVTSGTTQEFAMDTFNIEESQYTKNGKIAPGMKGNFEIAILPQNTQVSIRYDISINDTELAGQQIKLTTVEETANNNIIIKTGENTYTGIILLNNMSTDYEEIIKIEFVWENKEEFNEQDTTIGIVYNSNLSLPITVNIKQYLGEEITEYVNIEEQEI